MIFLANIFDSLVCGWHPANHRPLKCQDFSNPTPDFFYSHRQCQFIKSCLGWGVNAALGTSCCSWFFTYIQESKIGILSYQDVPWCVATDHDWRRNFHAQPQDPANVYVQHVMDISSKISATFSLVSTNLIISFFAALTTNSSFFSPSVWSRSAVAECFCGLLLCWASANKNSYFSRSFSN